MLVDIHAKSSLSDDVDLSIRDVLDRASERGLDALAFCETRSTAYCRDVLDRAEDYDLEVFIGVEIPTDTGILLGFAPDIDEFYVSEQWRRYTDVMLPTPEAVVHLFDEIGGAVVAARPFDREPDFAMGDHIFQIDGLDAVEVVNSRATQVNNDFAVEAATYLGLPTVGGSDPKGSESDVGRFGTFFHDEPGSQREFVETLRGDEFWAVEVGD